MMNQIDNPAEWTEASQILVTAMREELSKGSIGVTSLLTNLSPIWRRYQSGERTEKLLNEIKNLKPKDPQ